MMDGLRLDSRYSYMPNSLGYCGPHDPQGKILDCALGGEGDVRDILAGFEALTPYLKLIADRNGIDDMFDSDVVEAYWIGSELLKNVSADDLKAMMESDFRKYLPDKILRCLVDSVPKGVSPHHSFHVLHIQTVTGVISKTVENQDLCRVSWGTVTSKGERLTVDTQELKVEDGRYVLTPAVNEIDYNAGGRVFTDAQVGDIVSVHWNLAVEVLGRERAGRLEEYTRHNLELIDPPEYLKWAL